MSGQLFYRMHPRLLRSSCCSQPPAPFIASSYSPSAEAKDYNDKFPLENAIEKNASPEVVALLLKTFPAAGVRAIRFILQIIAPIRLFALNKLEFDHTYLDAMHLSCACEREHVLVKTVRPCLVVSGHQYRLPVSHRTVSMCNT
jgi:hypothetical protein